MTEHGPRAPSRVAGPRCPPRCSRAGRGARGACAPRGAVVRGTKVGAAVAYLLTVRAIARKPSEAERNRARPSKTETKKTPDCPAPPPGGADGEEGFRQRTQERVLARILAWLSLPVSPGSITLGMGGTGHTRPSAPGGIKWGYCTAAPDGSWPRRPWRRPSMAGCSCGDPGGTIGATSGGGAGQSAGGAAPREPRGGRLRGNPLPGGERRLRRHERRVRGARMPAGRLSRRRHDHRERHRVRARGQTPAVQRDRLRPEQGA